MSILLAGRLQVRVAVPAAAGLRSGDGKELSAARSPMLGAGRDPPPGSLISASIPDDHAIAVEKDLSDPFNTAHRHSRRRLRKQWQTGL